ncbi:MAG: heat-inducible transcriptional repressor HrcA [Alphaproteobacteria bacterium]|nr:heat-inducible transcriptional repressor HrcA [Alphaproteobacteria bacterium]OJV46328.1 MAG: heat-inducible transcriptional repressor HrcA [Alphaproteobacteria bacterium 43-37]
MRIDLDRRSKAVLHHIVDEYILTGEPVGSKTVCQKLGFDVSSATVRNVMAHLSGVGLLYSPHTSAGRLPTEAGLRLFVHGLLEFCHLGLVEKKEIERICLKSNLVKEALLEEATQVLSGLSRCVSMVITAKTDVTLRQLEFVQLSTHQGLVVLVTEDGTIENRIIDLPQGTQTEDLARAANYINAHYNGKSLDEVKVAISREIKQHETQLNKMVAQLLEVGFKTWAEKSSELIIRGQTQLLQNITHVDELEQIKALYKVLEEKENLVDLVEASITAEGVQIFIGAESKYCHVAGCSFVVAPYMNAKRKFIGAIGVVGPARMNYSRIIPMVDFTAKLVTKLINT